MKCLFVFLLCVYSLNFSFAQTETYQQFNKELSTGWNTWNYHSMLSHVLLPQGLAINISFRPSVAGNPYDTKYHYDEIIAGRDSMVRPQAHTFDGKYTDMLIKNWKGNDIQIQSTFIHDDVFILITPLKKSNTNYFVEVESGILWNKPGSLQKTGKGIEAKFEEKSFIIQSTSEVEEIARPYTSPYLSVHANKPIGIYTGVKKSLEEIRDIIAKAEQDYEKEALAFGKQSEIYKATQTVLGWNTLYDADLNRVITPVSRGWNEAWQGFVLFEWDTYFAALLSGLNHKEFAYSNAFAVSKEVNKFGAVAFTQQPRNQLAYNSQPPVGSMVCWKLYEKYGEKWFLEEVYEGLLSWNKWWITHRMNGGYITWGASWPGANPQDGAWESGLDNSPMYEDVKMISKGETSHFNIADVGLNALYVMDCQYLQKIAMAIGKIKDAEEIGNREKQITAQVQSLWSEEKGIYLNKYIDTNEFSHRLTPTLFYPMIAGIPTQEQAERMLKEHYYNPDEFYGEYIIPSCARNDKSYDNLYWRGAIWGPMNFLVYLGLKNYDKEATKEMAQKSFDMMQKAWVKHKYVLENINAEKGSENPEDQVNSDLFYQWGALMGLMQIMEEGKY